MLYIGCPQWSSSAWKGNLFTRQCKNADMLNQYAQHFNSVEGNTSFYADPAPSTVLRWAQSVPEDFKFTFKFHRRFSHELALSNVQTELNDWLTLFAPILEKTGQIMLQLPKAFGPNDLPKLTQFISLLPKELNYGVEVRHSDFFKKGEAEIALNQLLMANNINRISMDTRALFAVKPTTEALIDAQQKKPHLPVHAIATGSQPMARFVIADLQNDYKPFYKPWLNKVKQWLDEGKTPYVFFHTADNRESPLLARQFCEDLGYNHPVLNPFSGEKEAHQPTLF
ncbi:MULTISPECIES: DUF72 domain-containing protein [unclassified Pseudoalteromonas]|uniref:DUF72 domain-containing protein n=1 Tax=unclassified Pseudoalteromonas TaxID=194690 RepID=UPI00110B8303|nr:MULTISPECIES: DUF72 domain-containing protein [unclassified Pseudoalteromonas]MDC9508036.1 DUF72 domain-containing protein [Pseudoalteromonas sp. Angola-4]TMO04102.1 hypothetical protein CWB60_17270 [Pseudoalteromonas sp. S327]TMO15263.1 hypothetical protein CWB59_15625 [Pseudoalteromonas sp. S326]